jgi:SAM-dependent methyltransferase
LIYNISNKEVVDQMEEYNSKLPPFEPYTSTEEEKDLLVRKYCSVLRTQNGPGVDDYEICPGLNKIEKYFKGVEKGSRVLLLGVGPGREVLVAKDMGFEVVGTTLGSRNIFVGREYLNLQEHELFECNNDILPFKSGYFDVVAGFQVFEHAISPLLFLMEQNRVLKLGGRLILEWPSPKYHGGEENPHHMLCYTPGQAESLYLKAGFTGVKLYDSNLNPIEGEDKWESDWHISLCAEGIKEGHKLGHVAEFCSIE